MFQPGVLSQRVERQRLVGGRRSGLFAVDVLAGLQRTPHRRRTPVGCLGVEVNLVARIGERFVDVGRPLFEAGAGCQLGQFHGVAPDEDRVGEDVFVEPEAALLDDCTDRAHQVLVRPHAPGHAVHDDANPMDACFPHAVSLMGMFCLLFRVIRSLRSLSLASRDLHAVRASLMVRLGQ